MKLNKIICILQFLPGAFRRQNLELLAYWTLVLLVSKQETQNAEVETDAVKLIFCLIIE